MVSDVSRVSYRCPAHVQVVLQRHNSSTQHLNETLEKGGVKLATLMHPGKLVEVEYGHIHQVVGVDGVLEANTSFFDMHLGGECTSGVWRSC